MGRRKRALISSWLQGVYEVSTPGPTPLSGKAAFVSGASSGIGRAVAVALAAEGARVTVCGRRLEALEATAESVREAGGEAQIVTADFQHTVAIEEGIAFASDHWGGLDMLVNSAGIGRQSPLHSGEIEDWRAMLDINVLALAVACREALRFFPSEGGQIVNLGSMSGHRVPGKGGFYAATKFAVRAMTEGLRQELRLAGNPTRVSEVSPGFVDTPLLDGYFGGSGGGRYEAVNYPMLQPEDVAATVVHLLSQPAHAEVTDVLMRPRAQAT